MDMEIVPYRDKAPIAGQAIRWPKLSLTPEQTRMWDQIRATVFWALPFVSDIWYSMMIDTDDGKAAWFTDQVPIAATDGTFIYLNPLTFFKHSLKQCVFICAHEIMHAVFNHCGLKYKLIQENEVRYPDGFVLPWSDKLFGVSADLVINDILVTSKIEEIPLGAYHDPRQYPGTMAVLEVYRKIYEEAIERGRGRKPGDRSGGKSEDTINLPMPKGQQFDEHLNPGQGRGKTPSEAERERDPQQWINAINSAKESAKMAGNLPLGIERAFDNVMRVDVDWVEVYNIAVSKAIGRDSLSWMYLDPEYAVRSIGFPGRIRFTCGTIIIIFDTSGSINQRTINYFAGITQGIIETLRPRLLIVGECDWSLHRWDEIEDISDLKGHVSGGGGTSFCEPFERVTKEGLEPDLLVYLTDLEGNAPTIAPAYPVIWACTTNHQGPWGTTVHLPKQMEMA